MEFKDYYATLGVAKSASDKEIKQAFRKLARRFHPDVNPGDKTSESRFKEINEANEVLGDPAKRRKYDELGSNWRMYEEAQKSGARGPFGGAERGANVGGQGGARNMTPEEMEALFGGESPFSDFFTTFFGGSVSDDRASAGGRARRRKRPGRDVQTEIDLTLEDAYNGVTRSVALTHHRHVRTIDVKIPPGVNDGSRVRVAGEGEPGPGGADAGDLYLGVRLLPHPVFERRGRDIYVTVSVPASLPVCGGEAEVATLSGKRVRLRIPPLTATGQLFRLKGYGMPAVARSTETGDAYARIAVRLPTELTPEERAHWEALALLNQAEAKAHSAA
jgi:curved DNA-binding protein